MGFLIGFLIGMLTAMAMFGFLGYWLCTRSNHIAVAKAVNGLANALATKRQGDGGCRKNTQVKSDWGGRDASDEKPD